MKGRLIKKEEGRAGIGKGRLIKRSEQPQGPKKRGNRYA